MANGSESLRPGVAWTTNKALDAFQKTVANNEEAAAKRQAREFKAGEERRKLAAKEATELSELIPSNIWEQRDGEGIRSALTKEMDEMAGSWEDYARGDAAAIKKLQGIKLRMGSMINKSIQDKQRFGEMSKVAGDPNNIENLYDDEIALLNKSSEEFLGDVPVLNVGIDLFGDWTKAKDDFIADQRLNFEQSTTQNRQTGVTTSRKEAEATMDERKRFMETFLQRPGVGRAIVEQIGGLEAVQGKSPDEVEQLKQNWANENLFPETEFKQEITSRTGGVFEDRVEPIEYRPETLVTDIFEFEFQPTEEDGGTPRKGSLTGQVFQTGQFDVQEPAGARVWDAQTGNRIKKTHADIGKASSPVLFNVSKNGTPLNKGQKGDSGKQEWFIYVDYGAEGTELRTLESVKNDARKAGIPVDQMISGEKPKTDSERAADLIKKYSGK